MKNRANEENREMVLNNTVQIKHHADELKQAVKEAKDIPAWVVAKVYEATTSISNATHYLDGTNKMKSGGMVFSKKDLLFRFPAKTYTKEVSENGNITFTNKSKKKNKFTFREKSKNQFVLKRDGLTWTWRMGNGGLVERRYRILSPDGFDIAFDKTYTIDEISSAFEEFKNRYKAQGYYSTSNRDRIDLDDLEDYCTIVEYDESEEEFGNGGGLSRFKEGDKVTNKTGKSRGVGIIVTMKENDSALVDFVEEGRSEWVLLTELKKVHKYVKGGGVGELKVGDRIYDKTYGNGPGTIIEKKDNSWYVVQYDKLKKGDFRTVAIWAITRLEDYNEVKFEKGDKVFWYIKQRGKGSIKKEGFYISEAPKDKDLVDRIIVQTKEGEVKVPKIWVGKNKTKMSKGGEVDEIYLTGDEDWDKISAVFDKEDEDFNNDLLEKGKQLVKVSDDFGWDYLIHLKDGRMVFPDRNSGIAYLTEKPVKNVNSFVIKFKKAFETDEKYGKGGGVGEIIGKLKSGKPIYSKTFTDNDSGQIDIKDPNSTGPKHVEKFAKTLPNGNHGIQVATRGGKGC